MPTELADADTVSEPHAVDDVRVANELAGVPHAHIAVADEIDISQRGQKGDP